MRDYDEIETAFVESWKEHFDGVATYQQVLLYLSFVCAGAGIGSAYVIRELIIANPEFLYANKELATETQRVTKIALGGSAIGFVACHLLSIVIDIRFPDA